MPGGGITGVADLSSHYHDTISSAREWLSDAKMRTASEETFRITCFGYGLRDSTSIMLRLLSRNITNSATIEALHCSRTLTPWVCFSFCLIDSLMRSWTLFLSSHMLSYYRGVDIQIYVGIQDLQVCSSVRSVHFGQEVAMSRPQRRIQSSDSPTRTAHVVWDLPLNSVCLPSTSASSFVKELWLTRVLWETTVGMICSTVKDMMNGTHPYNTVLILPFLSNVLSDCPIHPILTLLGFASKSVSIRLCWLRFDPQLSFPVYTRQQSSFLAFFEI